MSAGMVSLYSLGFLASFIVLQESLDIVVPFMVLRSAYVLITCLTICNSILL